MRNVPPLWLSPSNLRNGNSDLPFLERVKRFSDLPGCVVYVRRLSLSKTLVLQKYILYINDLFYLKLQSSCYGECAFLDSVERSSVDLVRDYYNYIL